MLKIIAAIRRRPGMTHAEYTDYIVRVHGHLARANPLRLHRYVQSHVYDGAFGSAAAPVHAGVFHRDSVTELYFASPKDMAETFAAEYNRTVIAPDGARFAELPTNQTALTNERILVSPTPTPCTKIMQFLVATSDDTINAAQHGWQAAHEAALGSAPSFAEAIAGLTRSDVITDGPADAMNAHFGGEGRPPLALVSSFWVADDQLAHFRAYESGLMATGLYDTELSYFLFTREVEILPARN